MKVFIKKLLFSCAISCLLQLATFGSIEQLVVVLRNCKKEYFLKNFMKPPKINFKSFFDDLPDSIYETFKKEIKFLYDNHWDIKTLMHVFIGEYLSKEESERLNNYIQDKYNNRKNAKLSSQVSSYGLLTGCHTEDEFNKLRNSCELEDDDFKEFEPINKSSKVIDFTKDNGFFSAKAKKNSFTYTSDGKTRINAIKTLWPKKWTFETIIKASGSIIQDLKDDKIQFNNARLYSKEYVYNNLPVIFEVRTKEQNNQLLVASTYPKASDALLKTIYTNRLSNNP